MKKKILCGISLLLLWLLLPGVGRASAASWFATQTGGGTKDGSSWENAWEPSQLPGAINALSGSSVTVYFEAGTYEIPNPISGPSSATDLRFLGGCPTGSTGTNVSGRDPSVHLTTLQPQNDDTHVFEFKNTPTVAVDGMTLVGRKSTGTGVVQRPAVKIAPAALNSVTFTNVVFRDALYSSPISDTLGGAVHIATTSAAAQPMIRFQSCSFLDNDVTAQFNFGAGGGAVAVSGTGAASVIFTDCTFSGNSATAGTGSALGGAVYAETSSGGGKIDVTILSSRIGNGSVTSTSGAARGGALYVRQGAANKRMAAFIGGSVFDGNSATSTGGAGEGGAVYAELIGGSEMGRFEAVASTFYGNSAAGSPSRGGALRLDGTSSWPHMDTVSCTITNNSASQGSGVDANSGSGWTGNLIAGNTGATFNFVGGNSSYGYNLVETASSSSLFTNTGDATGVLPASVFTTVPATLAADGTVPILSSGPADGAVAGQGIPQASYPGFFGVIQPATLKAYIYKDQTGATRPAPAGTNVDIGAVELGGTPPPPPSAITPVTSVSMVPTSVVMDSGDTLPLVVSVLPVSATNWVVVWESTNEGVVTVSGSGTTATMRAVSPGTARVVATVVNRNNSEVSASCGVAVSGDVPVPPGGVVPVTGIMLPYASLSMEVGDAQMIAAIVQPTNATSKDVDWSVSPSGVVAVTPNNAVLRDRTCTTANPQVLAASSRNVTITAIGAGTAVLTAKTVDGGYTASCALTVTNGGSPAPASGDAVVITDPDVDDKLDDGGDVSVSPGVNLPAITLPGYIIVDEILDPNDVTVRPADPTSLPTCTQALGYTGTELGVDVSGIAAGGNIVIMPVTTTIPLNRTRLQEVLDLAAARTGRTLKIDDVIAAPQNYLEDLFTVLMLQQQIKEGPDAGSYVWLVPGVIEPRAAYDYKLLLLSSVPNEGITLTLRYYMADDIKGVRFVQGNLIVGDGQKNGRILDPLWGNVRAPASSGSTKKVDGGSGCNAGFAALGLLVCGALMAIRKR